MRRRAIGVAIVVLLWVSTGWANPPSTSPCLGTGLAVGSLPGCWFLGAAGASCAQTCAAHGLAYDDNTRTVAGSGASDKEKRARPLQWYWIRLTGLSLKAGAPWGLAASSIPTIKTR